MINRPSFGRSTREIVQLPQRLEALDLAATLADGRLDPSAVETARKVVHKADARLRHGTTHTLVALLGATGSGKSSMANAIAGSDVATTGVRRPTTSSTLGLVWGDDDASKLLDWLSVGNRHLVRFSGTTHADEEPGSLVESSPEATRRVTDALAGLVLLDVPDHDSVAVSHRLEMERIAEHADLLLWVTDPEKYADEAMHHYLRTLARHDAVTLMVLNKADRLTEAELHACTADLERLLRNDGIDEPVVFAVSAVTGHGVAEVLARLADTVATQRAMTERLSADVASAADTLARQVPPPPPPTIADATVRRLAVDLAGASGVDVVAEASAASYRMTAAQRTGWPATRWVRRLRPDPLRRLHLGTGAKGRSSLPTPSGAQTARATAAIREVAEASSTGLDEPWPTLLRDAAMPRSSDLHDRLDLAVADAVRDAEFASPRWWGALGFVQVALAIAALVGGVWLTALAANNWLRLPEFGTPTWRGIPLPTGLLIVGLASGWILAILARRLAQIGGQRRARAVRLQAARAVEGVADDLIVAPLRAELDVLDRLQQSLARAGAEGHR